MLPGLFQGRTKKRRLRVPEALEALAQEEEQKLIDMESVARAAVDRVQQAGIIFIDEIDKVAGREGGHGPDVSREGVQRDILPIVEGTTVNTKYGMVKTDHILFIAAGAFHVSKPSDLIPELQGRFPIRVELEALGREDFVRILTEPKSALIKQYTALLSTEGRDAPLHRRRDRAHRRLRDARQRAHREHRRAPAAHRHGEAARRGVVRGAGHDRARTVTIDEAYVDRMLADIVAQRRPVALRPVTTCRFGQHGVQRGDAPCVVMRRRFVALAACGKKGPPLAPLRLVPGPVSDVDRAAASATRCSCGSCCRRRTRTGRAASTSIASRSTR